MSTFDYMDLCRLCLVKDQVSVPIFEGDGDARQIFHKIAFCLPVKVNREDKLPKKICDDCAYKVELCYQFYNTTANAEKQLMQWLGEVGLEDKQGYEQEVMTSNMMKQEQADNRINVTVISNEEQSNSMEINMMDGMSLSLPIIMNQQMPAVSMSSTDNLQSIQSVAGTSVQATGNRMRKDGEEIDTEEDDNSDDECDADDGLQVVKEESENTSGSRSMESTTYVNVLPCNEAGPSGLQKQKLSDIMEMGMQQSEDNTKTGFFVTKLTTISPEQCNIDGIKVLCEGSSHELVLTDQTLHVTKDENLEEGIICELCGDRFLNDKDLELHLSTHEHLRSEQEYQIMEMEEDTAEEVIESTEIDDTKVVYVCNNCGRSFMTAAALNKHEQQIHGICEPKYYSCSQCNYVTPHKKNLASHERHHNEQKYKFDCELCHQRFFTMDSFEEHQQEHQQEHHQEQVQEMPFQCDTCNATFRYQQGLRLHAKLHEPNYVPPQKKHLCKLCNKRFSRKQVLMVHMRTHGNGGQQSDYICSICGKSVSSKTYLTVHMRKHTGEKPHICDHCGKSFISQNYLSVHRRTHTGERPHQCTHCEKRFTQRTTLVVHLRGHTGDKPYPCTICEKSFASKTMLNSHLKTHAKQNAREQHIHHELRIQPDRLEEESFHDQLEMSDSMNEPDHITEHITDQLQVDELHPDELQEEFHDHPQTRVIETVSVLLSG